ncbi:MAG: PilZ domain-containing protein [bacterium]
MIQDNRQVERRRNDRFDKVFQVEVSSPIFGSYMCVARNISSGGIFLETFDPLPLGSEVRVHFEIPDSNGEVVAIGEVKNHYYLNYHQDGAPKSLMGMGVRFKGFEEDGEDALERGMIGFRTLH